MPKKRFFIVLLIVVALGIGGCNTFQGNNQKVQADQTDEKQDKSETKEDREETESVGNVQAKAELDKLTDEEIIELIKKSEDNNHQITDDFTEEDASILKELSDEKYYDLMGMTDDEVLGYINGYHQHIDTMIMLFHKEAEEFNEEYLAGKAEFEWMKENYDFEKEYYNESINEILYLIDEYTEGNQDALFSLKYILYELNEEFNPESLEMVRANKLTLSNAVRIQNGKDPIKGFE